MTPKIAVWLMGLVTTATELQAILGDLEEESAIVAARDGRPAARRWSWRQSLASAWHLMVAQVRSAPVSVAAWAAATLVIFNIVENAVELPVRFAVTHYAVYHHVDASRLWRATTGIEVYVVPLLVGAVIARVARERAVPAIIAMAFLANIWAYPAIWLRTMPVLKAWFFLQSWPTFVIMASRMAALVVAGAAASRTIQLRRTVG